MPISTVFSRVLLCAAVLALASSVTVRKAQIRLPSLSRAASPKSLVLVAAKELNALNEKQSTISKETSRQALTYRHAALSAASAHMSDLRATASSSAAVVESLLSVHQATNTGAGTYAQCGEDAFGELNALTVCAGCTKSVNGGVVKGGNCPASCCEFASTGVSLVTRSTQVSMCTVGSCCARAGLKGLKDGSSTGFLSEEPGYAVSQSDDGRCLVEFDEVKCPACAIAAKLNKAGDVEVEDCPNGVTLPEYNQTFSGLTACSI